VESLLEKLNGVCLSFVFCHINKEEGQGGLGGGGRVWFLEMKQGVTVSLYECMSADLWGWMNVCEICRTAGRQPGLLYLFLFVLPFPLSTLINFLNFHKYELHSVLHRESERN